MADVFISYAREDVERARQMVDALTREGWTVWWDPKIRTGAEWERVLLSELERARCVIVLWSSYSVRSEWVRKETEAAAERAVLVPCYIETISVPAATASIQAANLTIWRGDPNALEFKEFLSAIRGKMLPTCEIYFRSLLCPEPETVNSTLKTFAQVAHRVTDSSSVGTFVPPRSPAEQRRLQKTIASIIVTVHWPTELTRLFDISLDRDWLTEKLARIPGRIPRLWLDLLSYSGPFQYDGTPLRIHQNYLAFASLVFFHHLFHSAEQSGHQIEVQHPLTPQLLSSPSWQDAISIFFGREDELVWAYADRIDDQYLHPEVVVYGPRAASERAYAKSRRNDLFTDPTWFEEFFIPQYELLLATRDPDRIVDYHGNARIRKVTDRNGLDL